MRSVVVWGGFGAFVAHMVPTFLAQVTDFRCGSVTAAGTVWNPIGDHDCQGNHHGTVSEHTIDNSKCWLRKGVDLDSCQTNGDYDYYNKSNDFEKTEGKNCFPGTGADASYGHHAKFLSLGACKKHCEKDKECEGITVESPPNEHKEKQEMKIKRCWLRKGVVKSKCHSATNYDLFMHSVEHPADFSKHSPGLNCYGGVGADAGYGASELKHDDGSLVVHLGDCKAACHHDSQECEAFMVEYLPGGSGSDSAGASTTGGAAATTTTSAAATGLNSSSALQKEIKRCWLRRGVDISMCHHGTNYDLYFLNSADATDVSNKSGGVNCYGGAGADKSYGSAELAHQNGSLVTNLGTCMATCKQDDKNCEAIMVEELPALLRAFQTVDDGALLKPRMHGAGATAMGVSAAALLSLVAGVLARTRRATHVVAYADVQETCESEI